MTKKIVIPEIPGSGEGISPAGDHTPGIIISEDDLKFLMELSGKMNEQNNRHTSFPVFCVQSREEEPAWEDGDADHVYWVHEAERIDFIDDGCSHETVLAARELARWYDEEVDFKDDDEHSASEYLESKDAYQAWVNFVYVTKEIFFTEEAANAHMKSCSYRYKKPRVYAESANGSYEIRRLMQIISKMTNGDKPAMPYS